MRSGSGRYLAVTVLALVIAVYLALQILGLVFKLLFLAGALFVAWMAFNAWRSTD